MYKVLYIEDEVDMVEDLPPVLKTWGLDVIATASIEEALRFFFRRILRCRSFGHLHATIGGYRSRESGIWS